MLITALKIKKTKVTITMENGEEFDLPLEVYADHLLRVNLDLSAKQIDDLIAEGTRVSLFNYALRSLGRKARSEGEIREKLTLKGGNLKDIAWIISKLKKRHYLDDKQYVRDFLLEAEARRYGKNKIIGKLKKAKIHAKLIDELDFDEEVELSKAKDLFPALLRKYQKVDIGKRKERIYHSLLNAGFDYSVISSLLSEQDFASPENDERLLKKAYNQAKIKYQNEDPKQRRVKIVRYLRQRGYNYSDIAQLLEEDDDEY